MTNSIIFRTGWLKTTNQQKKWDPTPSDFFCLVRSAPRFPRATVEPTPFGVFQNGVQWSHWTRTGIRICEGTLGFLSRWALHLGVLRPGGLEVVDDHPQLSNQAAASEWYFCWCLKPIFRRVIRWYWWMGTEILQIGVNIPWFWMEVSPIGWVQEFTARCHHRP